MITKFLLKNGLGSPGHTAKSIIKLFNLKFQMYNEFHSDIYEAILVDRMWASQNTGQSIYSRLKDINSVIDFLEEDMPTFVFLTMFSESNDFRDSVRSNRFGDSHFDKVIEVIYEV